MRRFQNAAGVERGSARRFADEVDDMLALDAMADLRVTDEEALKRRARGKPADERVGTRRNAVISAKALAQGLFGRCGASA